MFIRGIKAKFVQNILKSEAYDVGPIDGVIGESTHKELVKALTNQSDDLPNEWEKLSKNRKAILYIQLKCKDKNIDSGKLDGFWGPQTEYAFDAYMHLLEYGKPPTSWRDTQPNMANPNNWPSDKQSGLFDFYGDVEENQVRVDLPYTHKLAWDKSNKVNSFFCHEKVSNSIFNVLTKVKEYYGDTKIKELNLDMWGGCLNNRSKRGGTTKSTHAWGIALDYDPSHNKLNWGRSRSQFALPEYDKWWEFWEEEGWVSLGRSANFDWMHIQAAKLEGS